MFRTTFHDTITSPIPPDIAHSSVVDFLKSPSAVIDLSPIVTRHEPRGDGSRDGIQVQVYDVWETVDLLPKFITRDRIHWSHEIKFVVSFHQDGDVGCTTWIDAPLGLVSKSIYRVRPQDLEHDNGVGNSGERDQSSNAGNGNGDNDKTSNNWVLEEQVESSVNFTLRYIVESQLVPTRKEMHQKLFEELREASEGQVMS